MWKELFFAHHKKLQDTLDAQLESISPYTLLKNEAGAETRKREGEIKEQLSQSREDLHSQRLLEAAKSVGLRMEDIPDHKTEKWSMFVSNAFDDIMQNKDIVTDEDVRMLSDIVKGGEDNNYTIDQRNGERYKDIMIDVLEEWKRRL